MSRPGQGGARLPDLLGKRFLYALGQGFEEGLASLWDIESIGKGELAEGLLLHCFCSRLLLK